VYAGGQDGAEIKGYKENILIFCLLQNIILEVHFDVATGT
jgi:hypothetical protein